jgi:phenylacetate-CoA ligase
LTRLLPPTSRTMRRIGKITGRSDDMLIIRGVNVFPSQIEELVFKNDNLAPQYQIIVTRDGNLDKLEILTELRPEYAARFSEKDIENISGTVQHQIKNNVGVSTKVRVLQPESIERTQTGKAKRVIDKRHQQSA